VGEKPQLDQSTLAFLKIVAQVVRRKKLAALQLKNQEPPNKKEANK